MTSLPVPRRWLALDARAADRTTCAVSAPLASADASFSPPLIAASHQHSDALPPIPLAFTAATYNVLAQCLIQREAYPFASKQALRHAHRVRTLLAEITALDADVLALQECDAFVSAWQPHLDALGYATHFVSRDSLSHEASHNSQRCDAPAPAPHHASALAPVSHAASAASADMTASPLPPPPLPPLPPSPTSSLPPPLLPPLPTRLPPKGHGCVIAYKRSMFELVGAPRCVRLAALADTHAHNACEHAELCRPNVAHVLALRSRHDTNRGVVVSNTHLLWNPKFNYVRVRQCEAVLRAALETRAALGVHTFPLLLLGDWNSTPDSVPYRFLTQPRAAFAAAELRLFLTPRDHEAAFTHQHTEAPSTSSLSSLSGAGAAASTTTSVAPVVRAIDEVSTWSDADFLENFPALDDASLAVQTRRHDVEDMLARADADLPLLQSAYATYQQAHAAASASPLSDAQAQLAERSRWTGEPLVTTVGHRWSGTLDYIFVLADERRLCVTSVLELPDAKHLFAQTALPNDAFGSDHVCLAAAFELI